MKKTVYRFALLFRMKPTAHEPLPISELQQWEGWISTLANKNKLSEWGEWLSTEGRVIKPNSVVSDSSYAENGKSVVRIIIIKATSFDEAVSLAKDCPILREDGACVEVRKIAE